MGHKANRCQTEYGAATWRTTWPWRRCAGSDCFLVSTIAGSAVLELLQSTLKVLFSTFQTIFTPHSLHMVRHTYILYTYIGNHF